ncbi:MAG: hypothetical protein U9Q06_00695 [Nanoarchaeota archaeon]|nr:hypothetical protein [Nanoarchaeota archaeon]
MKKILIVVLIAMVLVGAGVLVVRSSGITGMVASGWLEVANYCNHHDCGHGDGDCDKDEDCVIGEDMFCLQLTRGVIQNRDPSKILAAERANYKQYLQKPYYSDSTDICIKGLMDTSIIFPNGTIMNITNTTIITPNGTVIFPTNPIIIIPNGTIINVTNATIIMPNGTIIMNITLGNNASQSNQSCHTTPIWDWNYCSSTCKCNVGEGDCDYNSDCFSGYCAQNVGKNYNQSWSMDICE